MQSYSGDELHSLSKLVHGRAVQGMGAARALSLSLVGSCPSAAAPCVTGPRVHSQQHWLMVVAVPWFKALWESCLVCGHG